MASGPEGGKGVFVTVGTTEFDALIAEVSTAAFASTLEGLGFAWLRLQVGRGAAPGVPEASYVGRVHVSWFRFSAALPEEMARAFVVVSHAGAGCVMEALELRRRLVVCVNDALMDNHQAELADALEAKRYLVVARRPRDAARAVEAAATAADLEAYPPIDAAVFPRLVDAEMRRRRCAIS